MTNLALLLLMQYVVSTKAGLVNHVQGEVNITATQSVAADVPIKTGSGGFAEVLLNPGSFLRVGENSEVVLESVDLTSIAVRVVSGSAVIEAAGIDKEYPIKVTTGDLTTEIIQAGIFVFENGKASIREGKLQTADSKIPFKKGWQVDKGAAYRAVKLKKNNLAPVETWSRGRSEIMAAMNVQVVNSYRESNQTLASDMWLFSDVMGGYTFMPRRSYRSPYGQQYYSIIEAERRFREQDRQREIRDQNELGRTADTSGSVNGPIGDNRINSGGAAGDGFDNPVNNQPSSADIIRGKNVPVTPAID